MDNTYVFYCGDLASLQRTKCGQHPKLMLDSEYRDILDGFNKEVFTRTINPNKEILMEVTITHDKTPILIPTKALLDSGANVIFIDRKWAEEKGSLGDLYATPFLCTTWMEQQILQGKLPTAQMSPSHIKGTKIALCAFMLSLANLGNQGSVHYTVVFRWGFVQFSVQWDDPMQEQGYG